MTEEQIKQNAEAYADRIKEIRGELEWCATRDDFIAGAHSRDEEIATLEGLLKIKEHEIKQLRYPWITGKHPKIRGLISDAVVLLIDGMFYRISHLERRKDGTEFWWGVHPEDGEEVDAWMPIPELKKGE